ncbi:MAG: putative cytochrome p450 oxidoreductase [Ramlibacter sp.]|nr:putative cytochrome p450 oxidoreductase [Ramlibacter sp.]
MPAGVDKPRALGDTVVMFEPEPENPIAAATHADPYPYYARLRRQCPLHFDAGLNLWVAVSCETVEAALRHPGLRVRPPGEPVPKALAGTPAGEVFARLVRMNDGDFHARHRPAVESSAQRLTLAQVAEAAGQAARDLASRADANALLSALPVQTMARLLGVEAASLDRTVACVEAFVQGISTQAGAHGIDRANEAARELMAQGETQGLDKVQSANRIAMMQQSLDATAGLLGNAVLALRRQPELAAGDAPPDTWRAIVAEVARWDSPVQNTRRFAGADLVLAGESIAQGQGLLLVLASANRDEALNRDPDIFDVARRDLRSLSFGAGAHGCPGELLAIEMAATALGVLYAQQQLQMFGQHSGFRPLPNARIPFFGP